MLKANLCDLSDVTEVYTCESCGLISYINPQKGTRHCTRCQEHARVYPTKMPYAYKLLTQELQSMMIGTIFSTSDIQDIKKDFEKARGEKPATKVGTSLFKNKMSQSQKPAQKRPTFDIDETINNIKNLHNQI